MITPSRPATVLCRLAAIAAMASAPTFAAAGPAGAAPAAAPSGNPVPHLRIAVDDGRTGTKQGDRLTYKTRISNTGTTAVRALTVTQTVPDGFHLRSTSRNGRVSSHLVTWHVDIPPGRDATFTVTGEVSATPARTLRLASVACALAGARKQRPVVCAADSDRLPAGAAAEAAVARARAAGHRANGGGAGGWWRTVPLVGAGLLLCAGVAVTTRRTGHRRHAGSP